MHGVKRLFAWMMPRFDRTRFTASLVSLRGKDLSEDTLEQLGIDVTYLGRHKFDPATFTHLLKVLRDKQADVVHLHGYGATTFGRLCAAWMGIPAVLHEHANHTTTPWFQQVADRVLAPYTDIAIGVSASTAEFTTRARLVPAERTHVVYLGAPLDEFARPRSADEIAAARRGLGVPDGADRHRHGDPADALEGQPVPGRRRAGGAGGASRRAVLPGWRGRARGAAQGAGGGAAARRSVRVQRLRPRCRGGVQRARHRRLPVAVGRHAADRVRSAGDGQADRRDRRRRPARRPAGRP